MDFHSLPGAPPTTGWLRLNLQGQDSKRARISTVAKCDQKLIACGYVCVCGCGERVKLPVHRKQDKTASIYVLTRSSAWWKLLGCVSPPAVLLFNELSTTHRPLKEPLETGSPLPWLRIRFPSVSPNRTGVVFVMVLCSSGQI